MLSSLFPSDNSCPFVLALAGVGGWRRAMPLLLVVCLSCAGLIIARGIVQYHQTLAQLYGSATVTQVDPLLRKVPRCFFDITWWRMSHLLLHAMCAAILAPYADWLRTRFLLSVGWEIFEATRSSSSSFFLTLLANGMRKKKVAATWWQGSSKDLVVNVVGMGLGALLRSPHLDFLPSGSVALVWGVVAALHAYIMSMMLRTALHDAQLALLLRTAAALIISAALISIHLAVL